MWFFAQKLTTRLHDCVPSLVIVACLERKLIIFEFSITFNFVTVLKVKENPFPTYLIPPRGYALIRHLLSRISHTLTIRKVFVNLVWIAQLQELSSNYEYIFFLAICYSYARLVFILFYSDRAIHYLKLFTRGCV